MADGKSFRDTIYWQVLEVLGKLLAAPGLIIVLSHVLPIPDNVTHVLSFTVVIVSAVVLFGRRYLKVLLVALLLGLCIFLAAALVWTLYRTNDQWGQWRDKVFATVDSCKADDDRCIALALKQELPAPENPKMIMSRLSRDIRAGSIVMQHPRVKQMLKDRFGIYDDSFLGTGFSEPTQEDDYSTARIPEYLVPNYLENHVRVWSWRLDPTKVHERTLSDVILDKKSPPAQHKPPERDFYKTFAEDIQPNLNLDDKTPVVVRVAQFSGQPSGRLGLENAKRVFVSHLRPMLDLKLKDVAKFSGRILKIDKEAKGEVFYIWIFVPTDGEITSATWGNILANASNWFE